MAEPDCLLREGVVDSIKGALSRSRIGLWPVPDGLHRAGAGSKPKSKQRRKDEGNRRTFEDISGGGLVLADGMVDSNQARMLCSKYSVLRTPYHISIGLIESGGGGCCFYDMALLRLRHVAI